MRILWTDYAKKYADTIDSLFGQESYPATNVADPFLAAPFISVLQSDTVSITLDQDRPISGIYVAGCNCAKFTIEIENAGASTVYGPTEINNDYHVTPVYFAAVSGSVIKISADIVADGLAPGFDTGDNLIINGIGFGDPGDLKDGILSSFSLPMFTNTRASQSPSGQLLSTPLPVLESREWQFVEYTYAEMKEVRKNAKSLNVQTPTYFDPFDGADSDYEEAMYMAMVEMPVIQRSPGRDLGRYTITLSLQEAR